MKKNSKIKFFYKYALPLFLLGIIVEILIIAPTQIDQNKNISTEAEYPQVDPNTKEQMMTGVHLLETHENGKDWELWSERASNLREDGSWVLENVKVRLFGTQGIYYDITGSEGSIDPKRKKINISGNVNTISSNGYVMKMTGAQYNAETKKLNSDSAIKMVGPAVKGESRLELTGNGLNADLNSNEFNILSDVKARKTLQKGQLVTLSSESATFNSANYTAYFHKKLIADYGSYRVTGDDATLEVDPDTNKIDTITVAGKVRLSDIQRFAVADKAVIHVIEKKLTLNGKPRLVQNNNELIGEEITFFDESSRIQVKRAKAKFDNIIRGTK